MSATNRGAKRKAADFYPTPAYCVSRLLDSVPLPPGRWLEPGAGSGAIIRATRGDPRVADVWWTAIENRSLSWGPLANALGPEDRLVRADFLYHDIALERFTLALGNPPYRLAAEFIERALGLAPRVIFLLRLNFLGSRKRVPFFRRVGMPDVHVLAERPSFTGGGTDATEYAWMDFRREWAGRSTGAMSILAPPRDA
jgi:hypothetical protein